MSAAPGLPAVGIDIVEVSRIERAIERRPRLAERLFTDAEREYAEAHRRPGRPLAARFAAKEAVIKALGLDAAVLREIEIAPGPPPSVELSGSARAAADRLGARISVSLSHEREHAVAVAFASAAG